MSLFFKNYSLAEATYWFIRFNNSEFILGSTKNKMKMVYFSKAHTHTHTYTQTQTEMILDWVSKYKDR